MPIEGTNGSTVATSSSHKYQDPATLNQAAPVQNTYYDILPTTLNARVYDIAVAVEDDDETLQVQAIIDGVTIPPLSITASHSTTYRIYRFTNAVNQTIQLGGSTSAPAPTQSTFVLEGRSVQVQVRKTTAGGTGNLKAIATYGLKNAS